MHRHQIRGHPPHEERLQARVQQQHVQLPLAVRLHPVDLKESREIKEQEQLCVGFVLTNLWLYPELERPDQEKGHRARDVREEGVVNLQEGDFLTSTRQKCHL